MTQYTNFSKNIFTESYIPTQNNIKLSLNTDLSEGKTLTTTQGLVTSGTSIGSTSKLISSANIENFGVNLSSNALKPLSTNSNNNQDGFSKPLFISNLNAGNNFIMNKNDRIKIVLQNLPDDPDIVVCNLVRSHGLRAAAPGISP
jgi:hypothetical protein